MAHLMKNYLFERDVRVTKLVFDKVTKHHQKLFSRIPTKLLDQVWKKTANSAFVI